MTTSAAVLCTAAIAGFTACQWQPTQHAAPGQPTMNELVDALTARSNRPIQHCWRVRRNGFWPGAIARMEEATAQAHASLALAAKNQGDPLHGNAVYEGNVLLGKVALRRGNPKEAARDLLAAADTKGSAENPGRHARDESAARARPKVLQDWAEQIQKGVNPNLTPTFSYPGCSQDPCQGSRN